jgi:CRP/FNR family transcriptional regulator
MYNLEEIPMFSNLKPQHIALIKESMFIKEYKKGSIVFFEGDSSEYMYIILEGKVKLYKTTPKGGHVHINILKAPDLIGEYACFESQPFPATCEYITDGKIGLLPFKVVYSLLENKDFSLGIIKSLTAKVMLLSALIHKETVLSSEAKVADIIINKPQIFSRLKNNEIADILNVTPETLSRILSKFKKEGIISMKKGNLTILNGEKLNQILETNKFKECNNCILKFKEEMGLK